MGVMSVAVYTVGFSVLLFFLKQHMNGTPCMSDARLDGKVVIVTGANTGLGKETAADLARRGGKVYLACRSLARGSQAVDDILEENPSLDRKNLIVSKLDLGSKASIRNFVKDFRTKEKKLDVLVNNAGLVSPYETKTEDGFEMTFGVNHLGTFLLTNLLMDEILAAAPSRIVTVSSRAHKRGKGIIDFEDIMYTKDYSGLRAYAHSKLANIIFSKELGSRLEGTGVTTYSLHPGVIATEIGRGVPVIGHPYVYPLLQRLMSLVLRDARSGAQTQICCAVDENLAGETGKYYSECEATEPGVDAASDEEVSLKLWDLSMNLLKLKNSDIHEKLRR